MENFSTYSPVKNEKEQYQVCCITMNMADRLRLLACPPEVIPLIRESIQNTWGKVQSEKPYHGAHEFKLSGYPWHGQGESAVSSRRLLAGILTVMAKQGWNLVQSTDVSKKEGDMDSLFFEKGIEDPDASLFAVSFNIGDRIRIVDAPDFLPYLKQAVTACWPKGFQKEGEYNRSMELKLAGYPWFPTGEDAVHSKLMLSQIIANFRSVGYKMYASVDISYGTEGRDLETWMFRRVGPNWE